MTNFQIDNAPLPLFTMEPLVHRTELAVGDMGVDLGCGDTAMSQEELHGAKIRAVSQQVGGKNMSKGVWGYVLHNADLPRVARDNPLHAPRGEARFMLTDKEGIGEVFATFQIYFKRFLRRRGEED